MYIERLWANSFRNLEHLDITVARESTVVLKGHNGQGKTNVLEALALCATGRSFRHAHPDELIQYGRDAASIRAVFVGGGTRHQVDVVLGSGRRQVRVDDRGLRQLSQLLGLLNVVTFFPEDLRIAKGGPQERRQFLDRAVANTQGSFIAAATAYQRILRSRNTLLRGQGQVDQGLLAVYNEQLVAYGAQVHRCRQETLHILTPLAQAHAAVLLPSECSLEVVLSDGLGPHAPGEADGDFAPRFFEALKQAYQRDRAQGSTGVGPHRGDLLLSVGGRPARLYASQGQQRALVLALKLAEVEALTRPLHEPPILVLDDVSSELDAERSALFFRAVGRLGTQTWISTTGITALPLEGDVRMFSVVAGCLKAA